MASGDARRPAADRPAGTGGATAVGAGASPAAAAPAAGATPAGSPSPGASLASGSPTGAPATDRPGSTGRTTGGDEPDRLRTGESRASQARVGAVGHPGGPLGSAAAAEGLGPREASPHGTTGGGSPDSAVVDRSATVVGRTPGPFSPRQLTRLDEALTLSSRETGIDFSVYVGALEEPTRAHAERLHAGLGDEAANGVLLAVSPGQRVLHIVTGEVSSRRLPDRSCALAALSMRASFSLGDLVGGIVNGLRMLSDQAGRVH